MQRPVLNEPKTPGIRLAFKAWVLWFVYLLNLQKKKIVGNIFAIFDESRAKGLRKASDFAQMVIFSFLFHDILESGKN